MVEDCSCVIFGATGNLSLTKLLPALFQLERGGRLGAATRILCCGRRDYAASEWIQLVRDGLPAEEALGTSPATLSRFLARIRYFRGELHDEETYARLREELAHPAGGNIVFYMSLAPAEYAGVVTRLAARELLRSADGWRRVVIEKPFGYNLDSARQLQRQLSRHLDESQLFRIDHYLGKGTVQNVMVFRFANLIMEPLWNRNFIDHVQITHSESLGVGSRAGFYDQTGALRDMIQSHLLQLMTLVAMEPPPSLDSESLRDEKVKVLKSLRPITRATVQAQAFRAQYAAGEIHGQPVPAYLDEERVAPDSVTETYAALKLYIDNWRWRGVPFYLRTGKRMAETRSMVSICFKNAPQQLFRGTAVERLHPNWVVLGIQPEECLRVEMMAKEPGLDLRTGQISLDARLHPEGSERSDAYEGLLLDVMEGDRSLFLRYDEIEWAWRIVDPVIEAWATEREYISTYRAGSWGPEDAMRLFEANGQRWRTTLEPEQPRE
ncbi:MAG: glucose-6-phosphate dehydrogenase [Gammaproteobacteria bacterium]|jgi:glucose-6-phosphate 1-dehydrogenase|nr:glucose-6-phosphate dehydrogenase [Gammaproteobacteria bacterium]MBP6053335.1 glucose-6-phosphate dehydrogenase [Pseudomonadales bacterium]MBK6585123.1 glucose-6-phosphate dehydrogenase [Gammaproteobacteria bacterium]MBK7168771.1 glucose-6-phosphate dehydrogenase [Gammaproteobacteria bacterium]MBK7520163.1 glucose-6-phosphate dehydrogenase [Gammaproteobacteria bacterium]